MKAQIRSLRIEDRVWAVVEECLAANQIIVNFGGDLIRITNESNFNFRPGQRVLLKVIGLHPLQFKLLTRSNFEAKVRRPLDVTI